VVCSNDCLASSFYQTSAGLTISISIFLKQSHKIYARKTLINSEKTDLLVNEIKVMNDIAVYSKNLNIRNICIEIVATTEISYDMKYIEYDLEGYILNQKIDFNSKFDLVAQLNEILKILFNMNILHRDIHPGNFLVDISSKKPILIISDFGLAKYLHQDTNAHDYINKYYGREKYICKQHRNNLKDCCIPTELFSVGRIINFIMKQNPEDRNHPLGHVTSKTESLNFFNNVVDYINDCNPIISN